LALAHRWKSLAYVTTPSSGITRVAQGNVSFYNSLIYWHITVISTDVRIIPAKAENLESMRQY
ncbi:MAG: hypothetical protein KAV87_33355, partial [Desulfobacteraceae bacterium]|nr:hypothetical protein [Desulfobacteraceae bacterium]